MNKTSNQSDICIIGGGLAGLTAATILARAGRSVTLFEKSHQIGGRAMTQNKGGFLFNQGPHALYAGSNGVAVLKEQGIQFQGGIPNVAGLALMNEQLYELPGSPISMLRSKLLGWPAKFELMRLLMRMNKADTHTIQKISLKAWLESATNRPEIQQLLLALFRVFTYAADADKQSAGAALKQFQLGLAHNVYYINGGWQTLVDGLQQAAEVAGVQIVCDAKVTRIIHDGIVSGVELGEQQIHQADSIIAAVSPKALRTLTDNQEESDWYPSEPILAASLDLALEKLPNPKITFAIGIDQPLYFSVHSASAQLSENGGAVLHVAKYLTPDQPHDAKEIRAELESFLESIQPGWRAAVVQERFLPRMVVSHALVTAERGGFAGRPGPRVPDIKNLYAVGDWVGPEGMLADAALASAKQAAEMILSACRRERDKEI